MLAITPTANEAVETIVSGSELPDSACLRITAEPMTTEAGGATTSLRLDVVESPGPDDAVVADSHVCIESAAAELLDDKLLDAELAENQVRFSIRDQESGETG